MNKEQLKKEILELIKKQKCSLDILGDGVPKEALLKELKDMHSILDDYFDESMLTDRDIEKLYNHNVANSSEGACSFSGLNEYTKESIINFARDIERIVKAVKVLKKASSILEAKDL